MKTITLLTALACLLTPTQPLHASWLSKLLGIDRAADAADNASSAVKAFNPLKELEQMKKDAVTIDRLRRGDDTIRLRVSDCVGTFAIRAWLSKEPTNFPERPAQRAEHKIWQIRLSSVSDIGPRPLAPLPPDKQLLSASKYKKAKDAHNKKLKTYRANLKTWNDRFAKHLSNNALIISPNFAGPGFYSLRLTITPEETEKDNWLIRFESDLSSKSKKSQRFQVLAFENDANQHLNKPIEELLHFFAQ